MKHLLILLTALIGIRTASAQKIDYKNNVIIVDGKDLAKVVRIKQNFGLTSNFEVYSLSGKKLITAEIATDFVMPNDDNSFFYYRFTFLTAGQAAVFQVNKLGAEKSFVKLIGTANIFANDDIDPALLKDFIARKSLDPPVAPDYTRVTRTYIAPIILNEDQTISQDKQKIGSFKDVTSDPNIDSYQISLPNGTMVARISFAGKNNAQNFDVYTPKDNNHRNVPLHTKDHVIVASTPADRNQIALGRILDWLVSNGYL
jgi:hypothetical protein